jgi:hypothetical protein
LQASQRARLPLEPLDRLLVVSAADEDLERHVPIGARVPGSEHDPHVAASDLVGDLEVRPAMVGSGVVPFTGAVPQRVLREAFLNNSRPSLRVALGKIP